MRLEVENLSVAYGAVRALTSVSIEVGSGEFVCVLGANAAGKSTLLNAASGLVIPVAGRISVGGVEIDKLAPHERVRLGLIQVPEGRQLFADMTVTENLLVGVLGSKRARKKRRTRLDETYALFPVLAERAQQLAGTLSGGEQQMLALARALMGDPRILMLDEPSLGLAPQIVQAVFEKLAELNSAGLTILLIEQNIEVALKHASRGYVLEQGRVALSGPSSDLRDDPRVMSAYLGA